MMSVIWNITLLMSIFFISNSLICAFPNPEETSDDKKEEPSKEDDSEKDLGTVSPTEMAKLKEEILEAQEEGAEKFGLPLTSSPEEVEEFLEGEEKEYGKDLPKKIEEMLPEKEDTDFFRDFMKFHALFNMIETKVYEGDEDVKKTPEEMKEIKAETFRLVNEINERSGEPEVSQEKFDELWNKKKEEYGDKFDGKMEKALMLLKQIDVEEIEEPTTPVKVVSEVSEEAEAATEAPTPLPDIPKEESEKGAFIVRNATGNVCILAKFHSTIFITYAGKSSEQNVEVSVPSSGHTKGTCSAPDVTPSLKVSWGKFAFTLIFDQVSDDTWAVISVELSYDTSENIFDGAINRGKVTAESKEDSYFFETPFEKSYYCPGRETILLYSESQHVATVHLKDTHLQPYRIKGGKFSPSHRCSQVVIDGPQEEFVQDETIPLAVGCTLALITLMILIGFSVHRAYHAAKVDYNTME